MNQHNNHVRRCLVMAALAWMMSGPHAYGIDWSSVARHLVLMDKDPQRALDTLPPKSIVSGPVGPVAPLFSEPDIESKNYLSMKSDVRMRKFCAGRHDPSRLCDGSSGKAAYLSHEDPTAIIDNASSMIATLDEMTDAGLTKASIKEQPWSDYYWPIREGVVGNRYADDRSSGDGTWTENRDYVAQHPASGIISAGDRTGIDSLSPAEKYDLLVGDRSGQLTAWAWAEGEDYARTNHGDVESWMGICHGWAPASFMLPRPANAVSVPAADSKHTITFFPSDIKALASVLWANAAVENKFAGSRCEKKNPRHDRNGRILDEECFDINPGAFHLALVNQIGKSARSLVMDAERDYEVWNQPIVSYEYGYFNPITKKPGSLKQSTVAPDSWRKDLFRKYRSPDAQGIVGVAMDLRYVSETTPSQKTPDTPDQDSIVSVTYTYDLEIDSAGQIIGGEWYNNAHPDFLWLPAPGEHAESDYEPDGTWESGQAVPASWTHRAQQASSHGLPLAKVVETLIKQSQ